MNYYEKYLKYKNKYLSLKGGDILNDEFIQNIEQIINYVLNINYNADLSSTLNIKRLLIFNILLYSGFLYRKKLIKEYIPLHAKKYLDKLKIGGLWSFEEKIQSILKKIKLPETNFDFLKNYSMKYYDNYPEIFNFNNDIELAKYSYGNPLNINDLFCLIIMIINNKFDNIYICLLKNIKNINIETEKNYKEFEINTKINEYSLQKLRDFNTNHYINLDNNYIFYDENINLDVLNKIDFQPTNNKNKIILFNIPQARDYFELITLLKTRLNHNITLEYNENDINDFNIFITSINGGNKERINHLLRNPNIFEIINLFCIPNVHVLDSIYNKNYINIERNADHNITYLCQRFPIIEGPTETNVRDRKNRTRITITSLSKISTLYTTYPFNSMKLVARVIQENPTNQHIPQNILWTSLNPLATVDQSGLVTAIQHGNATIRVIQRQPIGNVYIDISIEIVLQPAPIVEQKVGIINRPNYNELLFLSSYYDPINVPDDKEILRNRCNKGDANSAHLCYFLPVLTDHPGFLIKLNSNILIKCLSLNIVEYQSIAHGTPSMPIDVTQTNYFNRIKNILYLLVKCLKKENIEFCMLQELFKEANNETNLTNICEMNIFIKNYLNLYDYDFILGYPFYNSIIYKKNYRIEKIIKKKEFTSVLIKNSCSYLGICSLKLCCINESRPLRKYTNTLYCLCIAANIFNNYSNCNEIIMMGDFNMKSNELSIFNNYTRSILNGNNGIDHALIINRCELINLIINMDFIPYFGSIINTVRTWYTNDYTRANPHIVDNLQIILGFSTKFHNYNQINNLLTTRNSGDRYYFLIAIFYLYHNYKLEFYNVHSRMPPDIGIERNPKNCKRIMDLTSFCNFDIEDEETIALLTNFKTRKNEDNGYIYELIKFLEPSH
jgi:hypothetical protein